MNQLSFFVPGKPRSQGSKRVIRGRPLDDSPELKFWRNRIALAANAKRETRQLIAGPVLLAATFLFGRPKAHFGTGRNSETLKPSAPAHHAQTPDVDKLLRAVFDALTGVLYHDDRQICGVSAVKQWTTLVEGAEICLSWGEAVEEHTGAIHEQA